MIRVVPLISHVSLSSSRSISCTRCFLVALLFAVLSYFSPTANPCSLDLWRATSRFDLGYICLCNTPDIPVWMHVVIADQHTIVFLALLAADLLCVAVVLAPMACIRSTQPVTSLSWSRYLFSFPGFDFCFWVEGWGWDGY